MSNNGDSMNTNIAIGVMTHNAIAGMRLELLERTIVSIEKAFPNAQKLLCDNGSTDGTDVVVETRWSRWVKLFVVPGDNNTPGYGRNIMLEKMLAKQPDVIVFSDDDMEWKDGAEDKLTRFWMAPDCPDDLAIVSGYLEPDFPWSTPHGVLEAGGVRVLVRDNAPGAAWSFRCGPNAHGVAARFRSGPWPALESDFGYDHKKCVELAENDLRVAQIDLADHLGWGYSTHGNEADQSAKPLDRAKWGI